MKLGFLTDFRKIPKYNFFENPSTENRGVACGQTVVMKLIVAFRNFADAPKNIYNLSVTRHDGTEETVEA